MAKRRKPRGDAAVFKSSVRQKAVSCANYLATLNVPARVERPKRKGGKFRVMVHASHSERAKRIVKSGL